MGELVTPGFNYMQTVVGGVSAADVDGDGWTDLFVADVGENHLYMNQGDGSFREAAAERGVAGYGPTMMGLFLDLGSDGDPDLLMAQFGGTPRLLENRGNGTFREITEEAGLSRSSHAVGASAVDVDGDGDLDISVANYKGHDVRPTSYTNATNGERDLLYVNQGNGTFEEQGLDRGLTATRATFSHAWADHDSDGDPDLYVNVDFGRDVLYENTGNGTFREVTRQAGTVTDENGMGAVWTDVDNDRDLDLFATNIHVPNATGLDHFTGNDLFVQGDDGAFEDQARARGIHAGGWGWDSAWADLDLDGDVDAYQANGMVSGNGRDLYYDGTIHVTDEEPPAERGVVNVGRYNDTHWLSIDLPGEGRWTIEDDVGGHQKDRVWRNQGQGTFEDVAGEVGLTDWSDSRAVAALDVDHDGDLDLARTAYEEPLALLENRAVETATDEDPRHWLQVDLVGRAPNREAVGSRVTVEAGNLTMLRHTYGGGLMSQDQDALHFGLGDHATVDELAVEWPSGETATFSDLEADQLVRVVAPDEVRTGVWSRR